MTTPAEIQAHIVDTHASSATILWAGNGVTIPLPPQGGATGSARVNGRIDPDAGAVLRRRFRPRRSAIPARRQDADIQLSMARSPWDLVICVWTSLIVIIEEDRTMRGIRPWSQTFSKNR
jgi:hypothetical protein